DEEILVVDYVDAVSTQSERLSEHAPAWMQHIQRRGRALWKAYAWPNKKTEAWRYTHLGKIQNADFLNGLDSSPNSGDAQPTVSEEKLVEVLAGKTVTFEKACRIVFVDGQYSASLSEQDVPANIGLRDFSDLNTEEASNMGNEFRIIAETEKHMIIAQSESLLHNGMYLSLGEITKIETTIYMVFINTVRFGSSITRLYVELNQGAQ